MLRLVIAALLAALVAGKGLVDDPIAARTTVYLDGPDWEAISDAKLSVKAKVPGDLLTDLYNAGVIGDPIYELNFRNSSLWDDYVWTYTRKFTVENDLLDRLHDDNSTDLLLVFDGIKMGANIRLNGELLGQAVDQFMRYVFSLKHAKLAEGENANILSISFDPTMSIEGRFMACSGGWDWAPYTLTNEGKNASLGRTFTKGIWKSVYLAEVSKAAIIHVVPHTFYKGLTPTAPLQEHNHTGFRLDLRFHWYAPTTLRNMIAAVDGIPGSNRVEKTIPLVSAGEGKFNFSVDVDAKDVDLWWPLGLSPTHKLYNLTFSLSHDKETIAETTRRIGFRSIALVTGNDTDPNYVKKNKDADGNGRTGMFFRINGAAIFSRGANMIPMDQMEGRYSAEAHRISVKSAVEAGMNTLRIWGGGVFFPDEFYDACDEMGVLIYHDMQFAQSGHSPVECPIQEDEFRHQLRRLSHHTSIVMWDGCNECQVILSTITGIYASFVLRVVADEDKSRILWPSCPSDGWEAGVNRLTSLPNDSPKGLIPRQLPRKLETHGPYQHGTGFPTVNGLDELVDFDCNLPIDLVESAAGVHLPNVYASEFGCSVMSSFESMAPTLDPSHWGLHGGEAADSCSEGFEKACSGENPMAQRNYPCDNIIDVYFGLDQGEANATGEAVFKKHLFQCMIGQGLVLKSDIETRRSNNQFGVLIWQLGENWPTGGWGSIEYGSDVAGQVIGGRWKPLHYWLMNSLFTDITSACGRGGLCYVRNDLPFPIDVSLTVRKISLDNGSVEELLRLSVVKLGPGPGYTEWFSVAEFDANDFVLNVIVTEPHLGVMCDNVQIFDAPKSLHLKKANLTLEVGDKINDDGTVDIVVRSDATALYVTLTTLEHGRFSDNAMLLVPPSRTVKFIPFRNSTDLENLKKTLRVEDVSTYL